MADRLPQEATPRGGLHVFFRCPGHIAGNQKLAKTRDGKKTRIETRGQDGFIVVSPTVGRYHPTGKPYTLANGDLAAIPLITPEERAILLDAARVFDEYEPPTQAERPTASTATPGKLRPGDDYEQRATWADVLEPHGWRLLRTQGGRGLWQRPGKDGPGASAIVGGKSSKTGFDGLFVYSSNAAPFEDGRGYSKFSAYALLNHAGDIQAAARELGRLGYGDQSNGHHDEAPTTPDYLLDAPWPEGVTADPPHTDAAPLPVAQDEPTPAPPPGKLPEGGITLQTVIETFGNWLYMPDTEPLTVVLASLVSNLLPGDPTWLLLVATAGTGKTELLQPLTSLKYVIPMATLTEGALLSGTSRKERGKGATGGLLKRIGQFGVILCKDFGSVLTLNKDSRGAILQGLREIYDGSWTRHVGSDGGQSLTWTGKCAMIGGCTPAIDAHHSVMAILGERFTFYRIGGLDEIKHAEGALGHEFRETTMRQELAAVVGAFIGGLDIPKQPTQPAKHEQAWIIALARLTARCRSAVIRDPYHREVEALAGVEAPTRLTLTFARMLTALRVIGVEDATAYKIVLKLAMDSMPQLRHAILEALAAKGVTALDTTNIAVRVDYPTQTTRRALEDMACYHVVERDPGGQGKADRWELSKLARELYTTAITFPENPVSVVSDILENSEAVHMSPTFGKGSEDDGQYFGNDDEPEAEHDDYYDAKPLF